MGMQRLHPTWARAALLVVLVLLGPLATVGCVSSQESKSGQPKWWDDAHAQRNPAAETLGRGLSIMMIVIGAIVVVASILVLAWLYLARQVDAEDEALDVLNHSLS